ncbi:unnamed protein product [Mytilus coruscus]|uniref:Integrase core domain-containing protein n=1 Tax=Mytilus coruscus TaxID=42192 RepID=A0A6J8C039_MYTCO|nr:unnamed protein product [Mytilus coruscus]
MSSIRFMFILTILYHFQVFAGGFEQPLSWREARSKCKTRNQILSPLKSVHGELEHHFRSIKYVWTSNYDLNLGCNSTDSPVTGIPNHFQIGSNNTFEGTCRTGIPVDLINMLALSRAIKEMEVNTKYWINSTNIATDSFVLHCMLYTKYPNRTGNYEHLTKTDCGGKYSFMCSEGDSYGTVISKLTFLNSAELTTQAQMKTNQSGINSSDGGFEQPLSWREARSKCKTRNQILSPLKSVHGELEHHFRSIKYVWTSNYDLNLGCNSTDFPVTGIPIHFQIGFNNTFEGTCRTGIPVDLINMLALSRAIKEMEVNTKYWINSTNIGTSRMAAIHGDRDRFLQRMKETVDYCFRLGTSDTLETENLTNINFREFDIQLRQHTVLKDQQLDQLVEKITRTNRLIRPNSLRARLRQQNIFITRQRVRQSCTRVDPAGCALRSVERRNIERGTYEVAGPNSLWHIDGNHKLIRCVSLGKKQTKKSQSVILTNSYTVKFYIDFVTTQRV